MFAFCLAGIRRCEGTFETGLRNFSDGFCLMGTGSPRAQLIVQNLDVRVAIALTLLAYGNLDQAHAPDNGGAGFVISAAEGDLCTSDYLVGQGPRMGDAHELGLFIVTQCYGGEWATTWHGQALSE